MRRKTGTILLLSILVLAVASCGFAENANHQDIQNSSTIRITDMLVRQLTVPAEIS